MTAKLLRFPAPSPALAYPMGVKLLGQEATLCIDLQAGVYDEGPPVESLPGEPQVYAEGTDVVLDLGECTPAHTVITLDAEGAREWGVALLEAARAAKEKDDEGQGG